MSGKSFHSGLKILFRNDFGYIGKCDCCGEVQFCFGNVVSHMPKPNFLKLFKSFQKINAEIEAQKYYEPTGSKIMVRTPVENLLLSFSSEDFKKVMDLFEGMASNLKLVAEFEMSENCN